MKYCELHKREKRREKKLGKKCDKKVKIWKNSLLDLSRRNSMIYYKPESKRTLEIIEKDIDPFFETLVINHKFTRFINVFTPKSKEELEELSEEDKEAYLQSLPELHQNAIMSKAPNLSSSQIITNKDDTQRDLLLKNYLGKNKFSLKERGINTLYITFGMLHWIDPSTKLETHSPLVFTLP